MGLHGPTHHAPAEGVQYHRQVQKSSPRSGCCQHSTTRVWQAEVANVRVPGTTHQRPIDRFAAEACAMMPVAGHPSFLQATVRDRVVADDWLVSIECNRLSVPLG